MNHDEMENRGPGLRKWNRPRDEKMNHEEMENLEVQRRVANPRDPEREKSSRELEEMGNLDERENPQVLEEMGNLDEFERGLPNGLESGVEWNSSIKPRRRCPTQDEAGRGIDARKDLKMTKLGNLPDEHRRVVVVHNRWLLLNRS
jgi:hypothetical protein